MTTALYPSRLGNYRFIKELATSHHGAYLSGLYENRNGKKVFAKICRNRNSASIRSLQNEILAFRKVKSSQAVGFPNYLGSGYYEDRLYLLTEYLEGQLLSRFPIDIRVSVYEKIFSLLTSQSSDAHSHLPKRGAGYWLSILPFITILAIFRHPTKILNILGALVRILVHSPALLMRGQYGFVHRDLSDKNIILRRGKPFVYDLQLACHADPLIDLAVLYFGYHQDSEFTTRLRNSTSYQSLESDRKSRRAFTGYLDIFALYDLALQSTNRVDWHALHGNSDSHHNVATRQSQIAPWFSVLALIIFPILIFTFTLRGNLGNPDEREIDRRDWKENGPFELSPERGRFALTYSLIENRSFHFSLPLARFVVPDLGFKNGRYVSLFAPGVSYLAMPGYLLGEKFGASQVGAYSTVAIFAVINYVLIAAIARKLGAANYASWLAGIIFLFATPAFAYGVNLYQHHISTFLVLLSVWIVLNYRNWIAYSILWILFASSIPVDYPNLFLMIPVAIYAMTKLVDIHVDRIIKLKTPLHMWFTALAVALPLAFFLWFNKSSYDNPWQFSGTVKSVASIGADGLPVDRTGSSIVALQNTATTEVRKKSALRFFNPRYMINGLYILLFSPDRGTLVYTPVMLIAILGCIGLYRRKSRETVLLVSIITMNILLYGMWGDPWGGWAFGARYLIPAYAIGSIFIAIALTYWRRQILLLTIFLLLAGYSVYVNTAGALSTSTNPPQIQVLNLESLSGNRERYSFDRNLQYLQTGNSKSFFYRTYLKDELTAMEYFRLISGSIALVVIILVGNLFIEKREYDK